MKNIVIITVLFLCCSCSTTRIREASNYSDKDRFIAFINSTIEDLSFEERKKSLFGKNLEESDDLEVPRLISYKMPKYPISAEEKMLRGVVYLMIRIDGNGNVSDATISSSTDEVFEVPARNSVLKWRFTPAFLNGVPTDFGFIMPVHFKIK